MKTSKALRPEKIPWIVVLIIGVAAIGVVSLFLFTAHSDRRESALNKQSLKQYEQKMTTISTTGIYDKIEYYNNPSIFGKSHTILWFADGHNFICKGKTMAIPVPKGTHISVTRGCKVERLTRDKGEVLGE